MSSLTSPNPSEYLVQPVVCNACGCDDYVVIFPDGVAQRNQIVRCNYCGLMYASPRYKLVDSKNYELYEPEGLLFGVEEYQDHPYRWRYDKEQFQCQDYKELKNFLNTLKPQRGRLLEVGCSMGQLLDLFRQDGWDVQGVDPWKEAALFTSQKMNIACSPTTLEGAAFENNLFDVVLMLHVIEHVDNPLGTLQEVFRVLKPGGYLVLETPRYDTLMFKIFGRRERSVSCDGHVYFFTTDSLQSLYERVGFQTIRREYNGRSLNLSRFCWNIAVMTKNESLQEIVRRMTYWLRLDRIRFHLNLHDMQRVIVQKATS
ncbi:MAG: class I SAM-dependent methyltransferase [Chroococcidiopsidaceae cyanobacterium CP_BM_ER_R8_30]|nr:class I SAM-dependent methyltransferase [Chroococcidiopsidaceae cyanobacterium CP_BM_ER_R8_30]